MIYTVTKIEENIDYGCEERAENEPLKAVVTIKDEKGNEKEFHVPEAYLAENKIVEGDYVLCRGEYGIKKVDLGF